jgi:hypothetical protein
MLKNKFLEFFFGKESQYYLEKFQYFLYLKKIVLF